MGRALDNKYVEKANVTNACIQAETTSHFVEDDRNDVAPMVHGVTRPPKPILS